MRHVCMRLVALGCRGDVRRDRVGIGRSVATVALCRHDLYSIYLIFNVASPYWRHRVQCDLQRFYNVRKVWYHELVKKSQCVIIKVSNGGPTNSNIYSIYTDLHTSAY